MVTKPEYYIGVLHKGSHSGRYFYVSGSSAIYRKGEGDEKITKLFNLTDEDGNLLVGKDKAITKPEWKQDKGGDWKEKFEQLSAEYVAMCCKINDLSDAMDQGDAGIKDKFHELFGKTGLLKNYPHPM